MPEPQRAKPITDTHGNTNHHQLPSKVCVLHILAATNNPRDHQRSQEDRFKHHFVVDGQIGQSRILRCQDSHANGQDNRASAPQQEYASYPGMPLLLQKQGDCQHPCIDEEPFKPRVVPVRHGQNPIHQTQHRQGRDCPRRRTPVTDGITAPNQVSNQSRGNVGQGPTHVIPSPRHHATEDMDSGPGRTGPFLPVLHYLVVQVRADLPPAGRARSFRQARRVEPRPTQDRGRDCRQRPSAA